jgi:hypothetical protein
MDIDDAHARTGSVAEQSAAWRRVRDSLEVTMASEIRGWCNRLAQRFKTAVRPLGGPSIQSVLVGYEKAALVIHNEPIPWNAEAIVIESLVHVSHKGSWTKKDFCLLLTEDVPIQADSLEPNESDTLRVVFRLLPPQRPVSGEICWRGHVLSKVQLSYVSADDYLARLRVEAPTVFARLAGRHVPCRAVVASQCCGLSTGALLTSPTCLLPLIDFDLHVEVTDVRSGAIQRLPLSLSRADLAGRQAAVQAAPEGLPSWGTCWEFRWVVAERVLGRTALRTISQAAFEESLFLIDARYVYEEKRGATAFSSYLPARDSLSRLGPCFRLASHEPGVAGLMTLEVRARSRCPVHPPLAAEQEALVTDGPSLFMPLRLDADEFANFERFELLRHGEALGVVSGCVRPVVSFTSEGGYKDPGDFDWTPVAEQEMVDRMARLMDHSGGETASHDLCFTP